MRPQQFATPALVLPLLLFRCATHAQAPTALVPSGAFRVTYAPDLTSDPGTFWYTQPTCDGLGVAGNELSPALITRGATYGAAPRPLMRFNPPRPVATCNPYRLTSNIAADGATASTALTFSATVNPLAGKVEDNFTNNTTNSPLLVFTQSPRMLLEVVQFRYRGTLATGGDFDDIDSAKWMRSLYPVASWTVGGIDDPGPGLRVAFRTVTDNALENRVDRTSDACNSLMCTTTPTTRTCCDAGQSDAACSTRLTTAGGILSDKRDECAGQYVVQQLQAMRTAGTIARDRYIYGSIAYATAPATQFTRGFNPGGETIAVGPMKDLGSEQNYMAHEIGHALGRGHPSSGAAPVCGNQSGDDNAYPYVNARFAGRLIAGGPFGGPNAPDEIAHARMDFGPFGNSIIRIVGASTAGDIMSYCLPYGISSYTYEGIFSRLSFQPLGIAGGGRVSPAARAPRRQPCRATGSWPWGAFRV